MRIIIIALLVACFFCLVEYRLEQGKLAGFIYEGSRITREIDDTRWLSHKFSSEGFQTMRSFGY